MARTTAAEVKQINGSTLDDVIIDAYILSASTLIDATLGTGTTDILKEIERWLTAHMIAVTRERQSKREGAGGAEIEYYEISGSGLHSTTYGQMVLSLDTTGAMAALSGKSASVYAIKSSN